MNAFWRTLLWDWRLLSRSRIGPLAVVLTLVLAALAAANGHRFARQWAAQTQAAKAEAAETRRQLLANIAQGDSWAALPFSAESPILLPPAPLVEISSGRADLDPRGARASTFRKQHELFQHYEIDSPLALALGRLDLAFVIQTLLPLLVIALGYGILAEERELGLDRVLAVQQVPPRRLLAARLLARASLLLTPLLLVLAWLWLGTGGHAADSLERSLRFAWALALILGYLAFWWALLAWISTWRLREGQTLLALIAAWVLLVLAIPALAGLVARQMHPPPSRFELIAAARMQEVDGIKRGAELLGDYVHDHPELDSGASADLPAWAGNLFLTSRLVDQTVAPVVRDFDNALAAQQASVARWQFLTPALMLQRGLMSVAGSDEHRRAAFTAQARAHLVDFRERTGQMMLAGQKLDAAQLDALPGFTFTEPPAKTVWQRIRLPLLALWGLTALLLLLAFAQSQPKVSGAKAPRM
ncbi:MAG: DUF3526 domain-containing protein [Pseudomonadota bacterium]|nr:DUF3526 domain-containing protein [Pseudomonadota bacterium]